MASKSESFVLDVSDDDPSTTHGCTQVLLSHLNVAPRISPCREIGKKMVVFCDQGLAEKIRTATHSRTHERVGQRLSCYVAQASEFHALKVVLANLRLGLVRLGFVGRGLDKSLFLRRTC